VILSWPPESNVLRAYVANGAPHELVTPRLGRQVHDRAGASEQGRPLRAEQVGLDEVEAGPVRE
jgi:hypothetical protein